MEFRSGEAVLDEWLRERALANIETGASKTYVLCPAGSRRVIGFYALSMGQILNREALGSMRRNMPRHIPSVILGRPAIDENWQAQGIGRALLHDALSRALRASRDVSARLLVVHAISPAAEGFYRHHGFARLPVETPTLALDLVKFEQISGSEKDER
ncbi:GNAT family N-acetyltransferase [Methylosinus sp. Ce-a6]|uniref:GNAT family N-acetyltransferase n=1 Tax=Methylosinus sp. Ce-a6 TaxID=2172005 RepID=UPI0013580DD7|nr:GNAT family N-acetyltransferase [Methylosinus sp. Ce-a6]